MQQRQLRLGDILDDYCPRERRVTNHAVVAMVGEDVKQTRCTTCDADHPYKHAKVPRQRRKDSPAALYSQVLAGGPKRVVHDVPTDAEADEGEEAPPTDALPAPSLVPPPPVPIAAIDVAPEVAEPALAEAPEPEDDPLDNVGNVEEGPAHRRLIRATLPRIEGQPPPTRPAPDFTIRQPNNRHGRFRHARGGASPFHNGNRAGNGNGNDGMPRHGGNRPPMMSRAGKRHGPPQGGRKRSK
jgi:hypothetical protein